MYASINASEKKLSTSEAEQHNTKHHNNSVSLTKGQQKKIMTQNGKAVHPPNPDLAGAASALKDADTGVRRDSQIKLISIPIIQCNLNKAHGAQIELLNKINKLTSYIAIITEPYC